VQVHEYVLYVSVLLLSSQGGSENIIVASQGGSEDNEGCSECQQPHSRLHPSFFAYFLILQNNKSWGKARELVSVHTLLALKSQV